jgi:hypothetical protein
MTIHSRLLAASLIAGLGLLVMPGTAAADPVVVPQADYEAAYAAAADASGIFAPGATVTFASEGSKYGDLEVTVNPDGSLIGVLVIEAPSEKEDVTETVRCVRVDRCWEQSAAAFGDLKWHLLPPGSVTFQLSRDFWSAWMGFPWPADTMYLLGAFDDGTPVYSAGYVVDDMVLLNLVSFEGPSATNLISVVSDNDVVPLRSATISAAPAYVKVPPPPKKQIGSRATQKEQWMFPINH